MNFLSKKFVKLKSTSTIFYDFSQFAIIFVETCPDKYLPVDTSWALKRLLVAALAKLTLVWCPTWLRLLKGRGLSTLRTPNGATEEVEDLVVMIFVRSIEILNITVICKRKLSTIGKSLKWKTKPLKWSAKPQLRRKIVLKNLRDVERPRIGAKWPRKSWDRTELSSVFLQKCQWLLFRNGQQTSKNRQNSFILRFLSLILDFYQLLCKLLLFLFDLRWFDEKNREANFKNCLGPFLWK